MNISPELEKALQRFWEASERSINLMQAELDNNTTAELYPDKDPLLAEAYVEYKIACAKMAEDFITNSLITGEKPPSIREASIDEYEQSPIYQQLLSES